MNLSFQFESFSDLLTMSGHGPYVWACYAITVAGLVFLAVGPVLAKRKLIAQQKAVQKRQSC